MESWSEVNVSHVMHEINGLVTGARARFSVSCSGLLGFRDRADRVRGSRIAGHGGRYILLLFENAEPVVEDPLGGWRASVEQALVESRQRLRMLFESSHDAILVTDARGRFVEFNDAACDLFGCSRTTLGQIDPSDAEMTGALAAARFASSRASVDGQGTFPFVRPDDETRIAEYSTRQLPNGHFLSVLRDVTERRRAEDALRQIAHGVSATTGQAFFRSLVQYLASTLKVEYVLVCELDRRDTSRIRAIAASERGEIVENLSCSIIGSPCEVVIRQGLRCFPGELRQQFPDDPFIRDLGVDSFIGTPLFDSSGQALGLLCVLDRRPMSNIPFMESILRIFAVRASAELERKRSQAALVESEQRYRRLVETSPDGILIEKRGLIVYANASARRLLRVDDPTMLLGEPFLRFLGEEYRDVERQRIRRLETTEMMVERETQTWIRADGTEMIVESAGTQCTHEGDTAAQIVFRDVTQRILAEQQLLNKTHELQRIFDALPDLYVRLSSSGVVLDSHGATAGLTPTVGSLEGRSLHELLPSDVAEIFEETMVDVRRRNALIVLDYIYSEEDDDRHLEARLLPFLDDQLIVVIRDITRRRMLEEELRQAQRIEAIGQLASGIAHDFKNVLTAIFAHVKVAMDRLEPEHPTRQELASIQEAAKQAGDVVNSLLTFSRGAAMERRPYRLSEAVENATRLIQATLPRDVEVTVDLDGAPEPWVRANATQMQQVVMNLALNAADAMPRGGSLRVSCGLIEEAPAVPALEPLRGRPCAVLQVSDTGSGISPAALPRIFDPFFTTKPRERGTGLGLSVIHGIVREHGGQVLVDTKIGEGTTFSIYLPAIEPEKPIPVPERLPEAGVQRALLVEPDVHVRGLMASTLESIGYEVVIDGPSAMSRDDVSLLVVGAVEMDDAMRAMFESKSGSTPTVVVGSRGRGETQASSDASGPVILARPFRMVDFKSAVRRALERY